MGCGASSGRAADPPPGRQVPDNRAGEPDAAKEEREAAPAAHPAAGGVDATAADVDNGGGGGEGAAEEPPVVQPPPPPPPQHAAVAAPAAEAAGVDEARARAQALTSILAQKKEEEAQQQQQGGEQPGAAGGQGGPDGTPAGGGAGYGGGGGGSGSGGGGIGAELESLFGPDRFPDLLKELLGAPVQVLLSSDINTEDAASLVATSGCSQDEATRLLECLAVLQAAAAHLVPPASEPQPGVDGSEGAAGDGGAPAPAADGTSAAPQQAEDGGGAGGGGAAAEAPSPAQLVKHLGHLVNLVGDYPGLKSAAMARGAPSALQAVLLRHHERAAAANAALGLGALANGPPPHKTALIQGGVVEALLAAMRGDTAAHVAGGGEAVGVAANAANALAHVATGHAAGAAAVAAAGGIPVVLSLLQLDQPSNVRTNAAGVLVQMTGGHESYRAAIAAAGGLGVLAGGLLRGPDAPACNAALALYNMAALAPPNLRPAMAAREGPMAVVPQLLACMCGRGPGGASDESVAASTSARVNASAVLLELCKDLAAAHLLADQGVPAAIATLATGRLPPPASPEAAAAALDLLSGAADLLYPVPPVVRGNCVQCLMALARAGPAMQLELGRCGAVGALLELVAPGAGQDPAMQVNAANALCSLAAASPAVHGALVAAGCVRLLASLLLEGGDAARANVCAVFVTMMRDEDARRQLQECGGVGALARMVAALLDTRRQAGLPPGSPGSTDPYGVLCNGVGALAEAAKWGELRKALMQVEFGEGLGTLVRCVREGTEPAQVNAAAALCYLCRERRSAVQLGKRGALEVLQVIVGDAAEASGGRNAGGGGDGDGDGDGPDAPPAVTGPGAPSSRLRHNASRALARLRDHLEEEAKEAAERGGNGGGGDAEADAESVEGVEAAGGGMGDGDGGEWVPATRGAWVGPGASGGQGGEGAEREQGVEGGAWEDETETLGTVIAPPPPLAAY